MVLDVSEDAADRYLTADLITLTQLRNVLWEMSPLAWELTQGGSPSEELPIKKEQTSWGDLAVCISLRKSCPLTLYLSSQLLTESPAQTCVKMLVSEGLHCSVRYRVQKSCIVAHSPTVKDSLPVQRTARPSQWWARVFNQFHKVSVNRFVTVAFVLNLCSLLSKLYSITVHVVFILN